MGALKYCKVVSGFKGLEGEWEAGQSWRVKQSLKKGDKGLMLSVFILYKLPHDTDSNVKTVNSQNRNVLQPYSKTLSLFTHFYLIKMACSSEWEKYSHGFLQTNQFCW